MNDVERLIRLFEAGKLMDANVTVNPPDRDKVLVALREKAARENPKALSLEELRDRIGKPVWVKSGSRAGWVIVLWDYVDRIAYSGNIGAILFQAEYGKTWMAYDYPPKEDK